MPQIQGGGRVDKYRHLAYEWLGVDKVELAVMAELLLRGTQTVGELRGRAARMEPIKDLAELQPTLDSLARQGLIVRIDAARPRQHRHARACTSISEMEKVRREAGSLHVDEPPAGRTHAESPTNLGRPPRIAAATMTTSPRYQNRPQGSSADATSLLHQLQQLADELTGVKRRARRRSAPNSNRHATSSAANSTN